MNKKTLRLLRKQIDTFDETILIALSGRQKLVSRIGEIKRDENIPILDTGRWNEVLTNHIKKAEKLGISKNLVKKIYEQIHEDSLTIQKTLRGGDKHESRNKNS